MDTGMLELVNQNMCTPQCPCDTTAYNAGYSSMSADTFSYNGRSPAMGSGKNANGKIQMTMASGGQTAYSNFADCY